MKQAKALAWLDGDRMYEHLYHADYYITLLLEKGKEKLVPIEVFASMNAVAEQIKQISHCLPDLFEYKMTLVANDIIPPHYQIKIGYVERYHEVKDFVKPLEYINNAFKNQVESCVLKVGSAPFTQYDYFIRIDLNYSKEDGYEK